MATTAEQIHALDKRLVAVETTMALGFARLSDELAELRKDLSDQGRTPASVERAPEPPKSGRFQFSLAPGTGVEAAKLVAALIPILAMIWGVSYSGAQSGGAAAVTDAVEQGQAVPVSMPPTIRVVPVPVPRVVPVPVPALPVEEPPAVNPAQDLLPLHPEAG